MLKKIASHNQRLLELLCYTIKEDSLLLELELQLEARVSVEG